ncbi:MAG: urate hydroxylase PuuD [Betaproteobacteria bacterium]|nr:urate hydroxylase PuuD [Betaproteobacteria bacterium]
MESYVLEWLNILGRWVHLITGIAWIGASFYFVWLDSHLKPPQPEDRASQDIGIGGEVWAVHGGGFYRAQKFKVAPPELPPVLHWFKWEAYSTWLSGFFLLVLIYYVGAEVYLIDKAIADLSKPAAIGIGLGFLAGGWIVYDLLCRSRLGMNEPALAGVMLVLLTGAAYALTHLFSGRGAFIHFGAILGTIMSANVLMVIIPGQRELVRAKQEGRAPDPIHAVRGKQRSVHNTYFTLPVLLVMISNHYALLTNARWNWVVLMLLALAGALIRLFFVKKHQGSKQPWLVGAGCVAIVVVIAMLAPSPSTGGQGKRVTFAEVQSIVLARCAGCHAEQPTFAGFAAAPKNVLLDTPERIVTQAVTLHQQTVVTKAMPIGNLTAMTDAERAVIDAWFRAGASSK